MYLFRTLDPHPPTTTPILGQSPKKTFFFFTKKFRTLDSYLPIVWDKVLKKRFFTPSLIGIIAFCLNRVTLSSVSDGTM